MKVRFDISKQVPCDISEKDVQKILELSWKKSEIYTQGDELYVSIACVSEEEIQGLNKEYRGKDASTDVLSFPQYESVQQIEKEKGDILDVGELIVSPAYIERASQEDKVSFGREFAFVLSHGLLHLLGFEHSPKMFSIQDSVCDELLGK